MCKLDPDADLARRIEDRRRSLQAALGKWRRAPTWLYCN